MAAPREKVPLSARALARALRPLSDEQSRGARESLRAEIAESTGAKHVFLTGSARLGILWLLQEAAARRGGGEALLWHYNFFAVPQAAEVAGFRPVFVDADDVWGQPTEAAMAAACSDHTRVLLVSHHFGRPSDMDRWVGFAEERNIEIVEDCAHAFASRFGDKSVGLFGLGGVFSLSLTKTLTGVAGGAVVTDDDAVAESLRRKEAALETPDFADVRSSIISALAGKLLLSRLSYSSLFHFGNRIAGAVGFDPIDSLMTEPVPPPGERPPPSSPTKKALSGNYASLASEHLKSVDVEVADRRRRAEALLNALGPMEGLPEWEADRKNTYLNFVVRTQNPRSLRAKLLSRGFDTRRDYILPMNEDRERFPRSFELTRSGVYLPIRSARSSEIERLAEGVRGAAR